MENEMQVIRPGSSGFASEREYRLYIQLKKSLEQKVPVGIAS